VVFAKDRNNGEIRKNITAFIVPAQKDGSAGFAAEKPMDKLGWRASHTSIISLDDVKATAEDVLGKVGEGFKIAVITLAYGRLKVAAEALGLMERAYDETLAFVSQRKASDGGPLAEKDVARYQLAEMAQVIQATRDTVYNTALLAETMEDGKVAPFSLEAAQVKSFAGSNLQWVANRALELHGGYGFTLEYPVSVIKADSSLYMIGEGANNVLLVSVGSQLLGK
jgi:alkylation response protein AidB-like acyl-CoA dehydrogenase